MINTFRDRLMLDSFDRFRNLITEISELKAEFKKQRRRVKPPLGVIIAYQKLLAIASPLNKIFNGKRYGEETSIEMFCQALNKLSLLVRELAQFDCHELAESLQHLYNRLFILLPKDTILQPQLFDADRYQSKTKKPVPAKCFVRWLQNYCLLGFKRRDIDRRRNYQFPNIVQESLRLVW